MITVKQLCLFISIVLYSNLSLGIENDDDVKNQDTLLLISKSLNVQAFTRGEFVQTRKLKGFDRPLVSGGQYLFWQDHGLYWEVSKPFYRASTFGNGRILSWSKPGIVSASSKPSLIQKQIGKVLIAVLGTDIEALEKVFDAKAQYNTTPESHWTIWLTPKDIATKKALKKLILTGAETLASIQVISNEGDVSNITFAKHSGLQSPSSAQCALFYPSEKADQCK